MPLGPTTELGAPRTADGAAAPRPVRPSCGAAAEDSATCVCGHPQEAHEHYRPGSDCALCDCPRFRKKR